MHNCSDRLSFFEFFELLFHLCCEGVIWGFYRIIFSIIYFQGFQGAIFLSNQDLKNCVLGLESLYDEEYIEMPFLEELIEIFGKFVFYLIIIIIAGGIAIVI